MLLLLGILQNNSKSALTKKNNAKMEKYILHWEAWVGSVSSLAVKFCGISFTTDTKIFFNHWSHSRHRCLWPFWCLDTSEKKTFNCYVVLNLQLESKKGNLLTVRRVHKIKKLVKAGWACTVQVQRQGPGQRHGCRTSAGLRTSSLSTSTVPNRG